MSKKIVKVNFSKEFRLEDLIGENHLLEKYDGDINKFLKDDWEVNWKVWNNYQDKYDNSRLSYGLQLEQSIIKIYKEKDDTIFTAWASLKLYKKLNAILD